MATLRIILLFIGLLGLGCSRDKTNPEVAVPADTGVAELVQIEKDLAENGVELLGDFPKANEFSPSGSQGPSRSDEIIRPVSLAKVTEISLKQESVRKLLVRYQTVSERLLQDTRLPETHRKELAIKKQAASLHEKEVENLNRLTRKNIAALTKRNRQAIEYYRILWGRHGKRLMKYFRSVNELERAGIRLSWQGNQGLQLFYERFTDYEMFINPLVDYLRNGEEIVKFTQFYARKSEMQKGRADGFEIPTLAMLAYFAPLLNQPDAALSDEQINLEVARYYALEEDRTQMLPGSEFPHLPDDLNRVRQFLFYFANYEMLNVRVGSEEDLYSFGLAPVEIHGTALNETETIPSLVVWNIPYLLKTRSFHPPVIRAILERLRDSTRALRVGRYVVNWEQSHPQFNTLGGQINDLFRDSERLAVQALELLDDKDSPQSFAAKLMGALRRDFARRNLTIDQLVVKYGPVADQTFDEAIQVRELELATKRRENSALPIDQQESVPWSAELATILVYQYAGLLIEARSLATQPESPRFKELQAHLTKLEAVKGLDSKRVKDSVENDLAFPSFWLPFPPKTKFQARLPDVHRKEFEKFFSPVNLDGGR